MRDTNRPPVRESELPSRSSIHRITHRLSTPFIPTPVGVERGDVVDVLLDRGGYIGAIYAGRSGDMLLFRLNDGRTKGHYSSEIALVHKTGVA